MKKIISFLLCACMLFALSSVGAGAGTATKYVVLGDSIAYGSGLSNPVEAVYGRIVADTNSWEYANFAVPGHTTANLLTRIEQDAVSGAIAGADVISISIGGNNFLLGGISAILYDGIVLEDHTRIDDIADGLYEDLGRIVGRIRELNPGAAILLQTLYNPQTGYIGEVYQYGADSLNEKIREFDAANPGEILIVDVGSALTDSDTDFAEDRVHPSAAGNEKIAREVLKTLYDNGLCSGTEPVINTPGRDARGTGLFSFSVDLCGRFFHLLAVIRKTFSSLF
ncbi:MAG: hypothetical protein K6C36_04170 [Clostridia bacterium]|nr:hypothetical protein [Clostridia bacterium]